MAESGLHPCPCCGLLTLGPLWSSTICHVCGWEDEVAALRWATSHAGGANKVTLLEAQQNYARFGASEERRRSRVATPGPKDAPEPGWRPIDLSIDDFEPEPRAADGPPDWPDDLTSLYYWRPNFWRHRG